MMRNGKLCYIAIESNVLSSANRVNDMTVDESSRRLYVATDQGVYSLDMDNGFKAEKLGNSNMTSVRYMSVTTCSISEPAIKVFGVTTLSVTRCRVMPMWGQQW